jgi:hypothetical protein
MVKLLFQICCFIQGCSDQFFGNKGSIKFVKVLEPSNCSSSSMCNSGNGGFCWYPMVILVQNMLVLYYVYII